MEALKRYSLFNNNFSTQTLEKIALSMEEKW